MEGGKGSTNNQLPSFDAESKSAKIPKTLYGVCVCGGGGKGVHQQPTLIRQVQVRNLLKSKNRGGGGPPTTNFDAEPSPSPDLLKSKNKGGGGGGVHQQPTLMLRQVQVQLC